MNLRPLFFSHSADPDELAVECAEHGFRVQCVQEDASREGYGYVVREVGTGAYFIREATSGAVYRVRPAEEEQRLYLVSGGFFRNIVSVSTLGELGKEHPEKARLAREAFETPGPRRLYGGAGVVHCYDWRIESTDYVGRLR